MIAFGSGDPTRAICSTMIAEALETILVEAGICPPEEAVRDDWLAAVRHDLSAAALSIDPLPEPIFGGRRGQHVEDLAKLIEDLTKVFRIDPAAAW